MVTMIVMTVMTMSKLMMTVMMLMMMIMTMPMMRRTTKMMIMIMILMMAPGRRPGAAVAGLSLRPRRGRAATNAREGVPNASQQRLGPSWEDSGDPSDEET